MNSRQQIHFPPKDLALRDDVHVLGELIGDVLQEQGGEALLERVEGDRREAIRRRGGDPEAAVGFAIRTSDRAPAEARDLIRAFTHWFQVVNLAEKVHRMRRRQAYQARDDRPQPGGIGDCLYRLRAAGVEGSAVLEMLAGTTVYPVFTAHPTESTRRTVLRNQRRMADLMIERIVPTLTAAGRRRIMDGIRSELTLSWQTEEHSRDRLTVADEREHVLFYLAEVIYRVVPVVHEEIAFWMEQVYGLATRPQDIPCLLRFGSWVGGNMEGNTEVHAKAIRETLLRQQQVIISTYFEECLALADRLSQSASRVRIDRELELRIGEYSDLLPATRSSAPTRHDRMPYRIFLNQLAERLRAAYDGRAGGYNAAEEFIQDLELAERSLAQHGGRHAGQMDVQRLLRRARTFGFHLATLDLRQRSDVHHEVVAQGLGQASWQDRDPAERLKLISDCIRVDRGPVTELGALGRRTLAVFEAIIHCRARHGRRAIGDYLVGDATGADDLLAVLLLGRWAGCVDRSTGEVAIDLVPVLDSHASLNAAGELLGRLAESEVYHRHLSSRANHQTVLLGYSETNKEAGIADARYAVYQAQRTLVDAARRTGVQLEVFHGRGGTPSRGGGPIEFLVQSAPRGALRGVLRATEQGEVINHNYGLDVLASRTFEQAVNALLLARARVGQETGPGVGHYREVMEVVAAASRDAYRSLVFDHPGLYDYFCAATPIDVIERMQLGSRDMYRGGVRDVASLRASQWVFAWTQSRHTLSGWYGVGSGLEQAAKALGPERLSEAWRDWPFFHHLLADVEKQLARTDLGVAERYDELAGEGHAKIRELIRAEYELSCRWITWLKGEVDLLDDNPRMQRSIVLRSPYLDPLHFMQVDLLRRWRETGREDEQLFAPLVSSITGIAQGLQATG